MDTTGIHPSDMENESFPCKHIDILSHSEYYNANRHDTKCQISYTIHHEWRRDWPQEATATIFLKRCQFQRVYTRKMM